MGKQAPSDNGDSAYVHAYTQKHAYASHEEEEEEEEVRAAEEVTGTVALLWQHHAGVFCALLLNKRIENDLARVSAT